MPEDTNEVPILSRLRAPVGATRKKLRVGRGPGSGLGKTAGRGQKGQKARQPGNIHKRNFAGGAIPLIQKLPKVGFKNIFSTRVAEVRVRDLAGFDDGATVDLEALANAGMLKGRWDVVKVIGNEKLDKKLTVQVHRATKGARASIEAAGGTFDAIAERPVAEDAAGE